MQGQEPFWGDIHTHTNLSDGNGSPEGNLDIAESHLDFWAMADHAYHEGVFSIDYRKLGPGRCLLNDHWSQVQQLCRAYEKPGQFVPFLAYEWTNFRYGHHNVYYLDYDQPIRMPLTLPELYESLRGVQAFVIPHHGGYPVGICGKDWSCHDDLLSPCVEIYSVHGSSEEPTGIQPLLTSGSWMGPGASGGSVQEGLARGYRLGIMASSDSHGEHPGAYDNGLMAVYAEELTRRSLWDAFRSRRIYGVTGDRILLDFQINGHPMGSSFRCSDSRAINVWVVGWDKVERVDIIKNNVVLRSFVSPTGNPRAGEGGLRFRFMIEWGWDVLAEHDWDGCLKIAGGKVRQAIPCFRGSVASRAGKGIVRLTDRECTWRSKTEKPHGWRHCRGAADALAFEVGCDEDAQMQLTFACDGLKRQLLIPAAEALNRTTVAYMEDVPPTDDGAYWHNMKSYAKVKVHQAWLTEHLSLDLRHEDGPGERFGDRSDFYYVRVLQRNGGRAWSSPIWVGQ